MNKNKSKFKHLWKLHKEQQPTLSDDEYKQIYRGSPFLESSKYKNYSETVDSRSADESSGFDKVDKYMFVCIILGSGINNIEYQKVSHREDVEFVIENDGYDSMEYDYKHYMSKSTSELFSIVDSDSDTYDLYENIDRCHEWDWICEHVGCEDLEELSRDIINNKTS